MFVCEEGEMGVRLFAGSTVKERETEGEKQQKREWEIDGAVGTRHGNLPNSVHQHMFL